MSHAVHSPSGAKRWMQCPASVVREALYPDTSGPSAAWGIDAHAILEQALLTNTSPDDMIDPGMNDWDAKAACAQVAYKYAKSVEADNAPVSIRPESRVYPGRWLGVDDLDGTADIIIVTDNMLEVVDFKSGRHHVEATDPQLKLYLLGATMDYYQEGIELPFTTWRATIVQPRGEDPKAVRSHDYTVQELYEWLTSEVKTALEESAAPVPQARPSRDACQWCKAKADCVEYAESAISAVTQINQTVTGDPHVPTPDSLTQDQKRRILDAVPMFEGLIKAIQKEAQDTLEAGGEWPGYKLVEGRRSRKWTIDDEKELIKFLRNRRLSTDAFAPRKILGPAAVEKLATTEKQKVAIGKLWEWVPGKPTLAPAASPAKELHTTGAEKFGITDLSSAPSTSEETPSWI